ncbi:MAG: RelA/SpoT family protein [Minisyncoccia bacterium]
MASIKEITDLMDSPSKENADLVKKAYDFAEKAHEGQKRFSGEPYFIHVFETAKILAEMRMDPATISAGLLHDSIEDGVATEECIKKEFGDEILFLVNGVTKLGKVKYRGAERHIESLKKFLVAISQDIRVLLIKLADRLHNMRTLQFVPKEKQQRIALETLQIYAPLAYRLGIRKVSRELEDLSFKNLNSKEYENTIKLVKEKKDQELPKLEKFVKSVKKALAMDGFTNIKTDYRFKGAYSLHKKLGEKGQDIDKIYDILALRICVETIADCYKVLGIIHGTWRPLPGRIKDYIAFPKPNGYQSLHTTIFTGDGSLVEVQIRTNEMHKKAEYGVASHITYKGEGPKSDESANWFKYFLPKFINFTKTNNKEENIPGWVAELAESSRDNEGKDKEEYFEDLKADVFSHRIFIFTPKGEVIDLPVGSSVLDYAYTIHSDIGNHTNSARINGKIAAIKTELKNGDIIEIITKESSKPTTKWLDIVKTSMAKRHIKNYLEGNSTKKSK